MPKSPFLGGFSEFMFDPQHLIENGLEGCFFGVAQLNTKSRKGLSHTSSAQRHETLLLALLFWSSPLQSIFVFWVRSSGGPKGGHLKGGHLKMGFRSAIRTRHVNSHCSF